MVLVFYDWSKDRDHLIVSGRIIQNKDRPCSVDNGQRRKNKYKDYLADNGEIMKKEDGYRYTGSGKRIDNLLYQSTKGGRTRKRWGLRFDVWK